jgi:hypothetical protein
MTDRGEGESYEALAEHRLGRSGLQVKLDKGFQEGVYCCYIEYDDLAERVGFTAARRQALAYAGRLREQLARVAGYHAGALDDASQGGDPRRQHDLECTFLSFPVTEDDGRWHDAAMTERFRLALLRADQQWDQARARKEEERRGRRRDSFREQLAELLDGDAYVHLQGVTKERLLAEVTDLAFPPRDRGR